MSSNPFQNATVAPFVGQPSSGQPAASTGRPATNRQIAMKPSLWSLLRRAYAQFHVGLGTISPADAEEIRQHQEAPRPGRWYPGLGVVPKDRD